jgi:casein kinase II subunit beta
MANSAGNKFAGDTVSDSETGTSDDGSGSEEDVASWISWFCSLKGNEFFCEVEEDFIQDDFNLSGLSTQVPYYDYALDLILDAEPGTNEILTEEQHELVESAAEVLYGLIHVRYILTSRGMNVMMEKFRNCEFGRCPRVLCGGQPCLPVGTSDVPRQSTVKLFCPKCEDIFHPRSKYQNNLDGSYFGTTFPHLLLMTYPSLRPGPSSEAYVPRVFGFKLHSSANNHRAAATHAAVAAATANQSAAEVSQQEQQQSQGDQDTTMQG